MKQRHMFFVATVATVLCLFAASAMAQLPGPSYGGWVSYSLGGSVSSVTVADAGTYTIGTASGSLTPLPAPVLSSTTSCTAPDYSSCNADTSLGLLYYFQIVGGNPGDPVTVDAYARLGTYANAAANPLSNAGAYAAMTFYTASMRIWSGNWSGMLQASEYSGYIGAVFLNVTADVETSTDQCPGPLCVVGSGSASAYADPYLVIDPSTPNASQYSIIVSPGVGNVPLGSTPEPSSLMLLGSGVAGLAGLMRRRQSRP